MTTVELLRNVRRLEIKTRRLVNEIFSGQYSSAFRGLGMEFAEVREYIPGDDVRTIDWNVTARTGHPYIKRFMAEREMTVVLMVDTSPSMRFGSVQRFKSDLATEVAAVLAFAAIRNNDKVGLCLFSRDVETFIRPQKGRAHTLRIVRDLIEHQPLPASSPTSAESGLTRALRYLNRVVKKKAVVFLLSDFYETDETLLAITHRRHDLIALQVRDRREDALPSVGLLELTDSETGHPLIVDTSDRRVRSGYEKQQTARQKKLESLFRRHGMDHILLRTDQSFIHPLRAFFETRVKRIR